MTNTETPVSTSLSGYDTKLEKAEAIAQAFNNAQEPEDGTKIPQVTKNLVQLGGINEETLALFREEDLMDAFKSMPRIIARQIVEVFQTKKPAEEKKGEEESSHYISKRKASRMRFEQLLGFYQPGEFDAVSEKLNELARSQPIIVFLPEGGVDVKTSSELLKEIRAGFGPRPNLLIEVNGNYRTIHKVGENPDIIYQENPLYPGRPLRPDGTCDQLNRSWEGVPKNVRQFIWLAVNKTQELKLNVLQAHDILDLCLEENPWNYFKTRFQKTAILFQELAENEELPKLRIRNGKASQIKKIQSNSPFNIPTGSHL